MFCLVSANITSEVVDQAKNERDSATFICQATGTPIPTISWFFNDSSVNGKTNVNKYNISQSSSSNTIISTLTILNVESSDVGTYLCNATNEESYDTSSAVLTVNGKLSCSHHAVL